MSVENDPNYVRIPQFDYGTKIISTDSGIEYCVEYLSQDKKESRLLWFKQSGEYIRLNANLKNKEEDLHPIT